MNSLQEAVSSALGAEVQDFVPLFPGKKVSGGLSEDDEYWYRSAISVPGMIPEILTYYFSKNEKIQQDLENLSEIYRETGAIPSQHLWIGGITPLPYSPADIAAVDLNLQIKSQEKFRAEIAKFPDYLSESAVAELYEKTVYRSKAKPTNQRLVCTFQDYVDVYQFLKKSQDGKIPTGYRDFDNALGGGWEKGQSYAGVAGTGVGKTTFLTNFVANLIRQGYRVGFLSTEMGLEKIIERTGKAYYDKDTFEQVLLEMHNGSNLPTGSIDIKVFGCGEISAMDIGRLYTNSNIDILFVDYADELKPSTKAESAYYAYANVFKELRNVAVSLDIPIVTVTQGNRGMWDKEGGTVASAGQTSIADSIAKLNGVTMAWNILQPKEMIPGLHGGWGGFIVEIIKNRYGSKTTFELEFNSNTCKIIEYPSPVEAPVHLVPPTKNKKPKGAK